MTGFGPALFGGGDGPAGLSKPGSHRCGRPERPRLERSTAPLSFRPSIANCSWCSPAVSGTAMALLPPWCADIARSRSRPSALTQTDGSGDRLTAARIVGGGLGPDERLGAPVVLGDVAFDRRLQVDDAGEGASPQPTTVSAEKKPSTALSHEAEVGVKWNVQRGCRASQARTFGFFGGDVVEDRVDCFAGRTVASTGVQEPDELTVPGGAACSASTVPARTSRAANSVVVP